ncbi:MAG: RraA family protein [Candidatus Bathyarchaeota archaeon]|nr:RraA family protein [Candidatus Bathyarchaeota archaeon]
MVTQEERERILRLYEGLRVTDVCDGMDAVGLQDVGTMDREIRPLWRDIEGFKHRIFGISLTLRFVPTNKRAPSFPNVEAYSKWKSNWYREISKDHVKENLSNGDIIVIDAAGTGDIGFIGSNNSLGWIKTGAKGVVTNAGCRDTDEIIKEQVPVYCKYISRGIRPGRLEFESINKPVNCGGVLVYPGDVVVADGDGVIVVPWEKAESVAEYAIRVQEADKRSRRKHYKALNIPMDFTTEKRNLAERK